MLLRGTLFFCLVALAVGRGLTGTPPVRSEQSAQLGDPFKSIFSNGFAPGCYWSASGAFNITNVPKAGQDGDTGLCTTFPQAGGFMVFTCSGDLNLTNFLPLSTGLLYSISTVTVNQTTAADQVAQIPSGLRVVIKDNQHHTVCSLPVGANQNQDVSFSERLVDTSSLYTDQPVDGGRSCNTARQNATYIGFEAVTDDISFCLDNLRLLYRSA